ncbi:MAG: hypothetical protein Q8S29_17440, partial [Phreatobacter sp.]|nr:hypothetical protein [Phreatobacter sp.]
MSGKSLVPEAQLASRVDGSRLTVALAGNWTAETAGAIEPEVTRLLAESGSPASVFLDFSRVER